MLSNIKEVFGTMHYLLAARNENEMRWNITLLPPIVLVVVRSTCSCNAQLRVLLRCEFMNFMWRRYLLSLLLFLEGSSSSCVRRSTVLQALSQNQWGMDMEYTGVVKRWTQSQTSKKWNRSKQENRPTQNNATRFFLFPCVPRWKKVLWTLDLT